MNKYFGTIRIWLFNALLILLFAFTYLKYIKLALTPNVDVQSIPSTKDRGSIVDRSGKRLAVQTDFYHFIVTPRDVTDVEYFAQAVAPALDMNPYEIVQMINANSNRSFLYVKKRLDVTEQTELKKIIDANNFNYAGFERIPGRVYPENALASQLIGYMGNDGVGLSGIEYIMQDTLSPQISSDASADRHGQNVYLTIDANLQYKLEQIAQDTMRQTQAESMMLIAASAKSGEILSYISLPSIDLNEYTRATPAQTMDRPAVYAYEPGSVFKIFSAAILLDTNSVNEVDSFLCDGVYEKVFDHDRIRITCLEHHGWLNVRGALQYSCNEYFAQATERISTPVFLEKIHTLGFGEKTGIELPGETRGSVKNEEDRLWSARSKPTMSIGQELSVSALQMVQAATAIANKGTPIQLTVISRITTHDGKDLFIHKPVLKPQVFSERTAATILSDMETVAQSGTGSRANIRDISIGVKTGTAQMADHERGGYSQTDFLSNCLAIFPTKDPEIILYIVIEKAKGETYAGRIVAPVINEAANVIIDHLGIQRGGALGVEHSGVISIQSSTPVEIGDTLPNLIGVPKKDLVKLLQRKDLNVQIKGEGYVKVQIPSAGTPITENMTIELYLE